MPLIENKVEVWLTTAYDHLLDGDPVIQKIVYEKEEVAIMIETMKSVNREVEKSEMRENSIYVKFKNGAWIHAKRSEIRIKIKVE